MKNKLIYFGIIILTLFCSNSNGFAEGEALQTAETVTPASVENQPATNETEAGDKRKAFIQELNTKAAELRFQLAQLVTPESKQERIEDVTCKSFFIKQV